MMAVGNGVQAESLASPYKNYKELKEMKTRIGIAGYGNLGRGVEFAVAQNPDTELVAVFTRRNPETVKIQTEGVKVYPIAEAASHKDEIDVLILCGGSATDLPVQTPEYGKELQRYRQL